MTLMMLTMTAYKHVHEFLSIFLQTFPGKPNIAFLEKYA